MDDRRYRRSPCPDRGTWFHRSPCAPPAAWRNTWRRASRSCQKPCRRPQPARRNGGCRGKSSPGTLVPAEMQHREAQGPVAEEHAVRLFRIVALLDPADLGEIERLLVELGSCKRIFRGKCDVTKLRHADSPAGCEKLKGRCVEAVNLTRRFRRNIAAHDVGAYALTIAMLRIAVATAAPGPDAHAVAGVEHQRLLERHLRRTVGTLDQHMTRLALAAAVNAPSRRNGAFEARRDAARRQHQIASLQPKAAAELPGDRRNRCANRSSRP